jgi:hypothetical protein
MAILSVSDLAASVNFTDIAISILAVALCFISVAVVYKGAALIVRFVNGSEGEGVPSNGGSRLLDDLKKNRL